MSDDCIDDLDFDFADGESDCCGAPIILGDICSECGEHCEPAASDEWYESR